MVCSHTAIWFQLENHSYYEVERYGRKHAHSRDTNTVIALENEKQCSLKCIAPPPLHFAGRSRVSEGSCNQRAKTGPESAPSHLPIRRHGVDRRRTGPLNWLAQCAKRERAHIVYCRRLLKATVWQCGSKLVDSFPLLLRRSRDGASLADLFDGDCTRAGWVAISPV